MPIFSTNKGHGNWFQKSEAKTIEDGIESHLFFHGIFIFYIITKKATDNKGIHVAPLNINVCICCGSNLFSV